MAGGRRPTNAPDIPFPSKPNIVINQKVDWEDASIMHQKTGRCTDQKYGKKDQNKNFVQSQ